MMDEHLKFEEKINYYNSKSSKTIIIAPDVMVESEGLACGDKLKLSLSSAGGRCEFSFESEGCSICSAAGSFLVEELSGREESAIYAFTSDILEGRYDDRSKWLEEAPSERKMCIRTAVKLLQEAVSSINPQCAVTSSAQLLACDACVRSFTINWGGQEEEKQEKKSLRAMIKQVNSLEDPLEMKLQRLGRSVLSPGEAEELKETLEKMDKATYKKAKKLRLPMLYRNNMKKYLDYNGSGEVMLIAKKQIAAQVVTSREINEINEHIKKNNWSISKVKGARTADYYDHGLFRTYLDYDYVAADIKHGAEFINYLVNVKGFKFVTGGSVPFSLKIVDDYGGRETLTGHLHLEKIVQDAFQVVVDINLGGFPLGRTGIVKLSEEKVVSPGEQFVITLCHIFKHENVYMKDINDIYYLLKSGVLDFEKLSKLIELNELQLYFYILMEYMKSNFDLKEIGIKGFDAIRNRVIYSIFESSWPYSRKSHFWIKLQDTIIRCVKANGIIKGAIEAYKQCMGAETEGIPAEIYRGINSKKNTRTYLYPAVIFKNTISLEKIQGAEGYEEIIKDCIYKYEGKESNIVITSFGVFISQENMSESKNRSEVIKDAEKVLAKLKIDAACVNQEYIMQARPDLWLY